ncbi:hypothetical protein Y032_0307g2028 [Ancylostoma ceylanicum]|uniref:Uncharacterized protein n=1 Tax=Ancylostoma ceylanicum TaxID=53326 RepID=A0A016S2Q7_9BILA|nr:hypothetical protein Y032_0307g2028 [Ancylostoma ceylanicum]
MDLLAILLHINHHLSPVSHAIIYLVYLCKTPSGNAPPENGSAAQLLEKTMTTVIIITTMPSTAATSKKKAQE